MYIRNETIPAVTVIDNCFIDNYMPEASGEYVKVYLYLLRLAQGPDREIGIGVIADGLDHTEKDVVRALRYWEKQGLLSLEMTKRKEIAGIRILPIPQAAEKESEMEVQTEETTVDVPEESTPVSKGISREQDDARETVKPKVPRAKVEAIPMEAVAELNTQDDFREVVMVAETYLGRTLSPKDVQLFAYLYDELHFPKDLLEYLVEYCVDGGHKSNRYMETVALNWHQEGKLTVEAARESSRAYSKENKAVMKAFGINNRVLNPEERGYIEKWTKEYGMPVEVVEEACTITMSAIQKASFPYTDKILSDWHIAGIHTLEEARKYRENRKGSRKASEAAQSSRSNTGNGKNRFRNYQQRNIDYDSLLTQGGINPYGTDGSESDNPEE